MLAALVALVPAAAGPGAFVAATAAIAEMAGSHAHHVSVQRDRGHVDVVLCHEEWAGTAEVVIAPASDCSDDHRLHVASDHGLLAHSAAKWNVWRASALAAPIAPARLRALSAVQIRWRAPSVDPPAAAAPLERTAILQI